MEQYIKKSDLVAEIEKLHGNPFYRMAIKDVLLILDTLEVTEVDLEKHLKEDIEDVFFDLNGVAVKGATHYLTVEDVKDIAKHFFELGLKAQHDNWKVVDNINPPQADKNKIYCVLSKKNKYLLARVINHPQDEDLLQWKCTEFPFHRYDMCEGDKYMQII